MFHKELKRSGNHAILGITDSAARWVDNMRVQGISYEEIARMINTRQADEYFKAALLYYTVLNRRAAAHAANAAGLNFMARAQRAQLSILSRSHPCFCSIHPACLNSACLNPLLTRERGHSIAQMCPPRPPAEADHCPCPPRQAQPPAGGRQLPKLEDTPRFFLDVTAQQIQDLHQLFAATQKAAQHAYITQMVGGTLFRTDHTFRVALRV